MLTKFERFNKKTEVKEWYIGCDGVLKSIDSEPRANKISGKKYYRFTADINTPEGTLLIGGQLYEALIPHLGKTPEVGDKLDFNCKVDDLQTEQVNTRWGIGGQAVDASSSILNILDDPIFKKYNKINKKTNKEELFIACIGKIRTIDSEFRMNKVSYNKYCRFTGIIEYSKNKIIIGGQVYKEQFEELGRKPEVGDNVNFWCNLRFLEEGRNKNWRIGMIIGVEKDGFSETYYENGILKCTGIFKNGLKDGIWETYYNTGKLNSRVRYLMDVKDGIEEVWLPSGQLISKVNFKKGLKEGSFEYYYPNGQLKEKGTFFKNSKRDGIYEKYFENGDLEERLFYNKGNIIRDLEEEINNVLNEPSVKDSKTDNIHSIDSNTIYSLSFDELVEHTYSSFAREFGERKLKKVMNKVLTSRKVEGFVRESKLKRIAPHNDYIIQMLNEIPFFIFSRGQTVVVGAMVALQKWNEEANNTTYMLSNEELRQKAVYIITESKSMFF